MFLPGSSYPHSEHQLCFLASSGLISVDGEEVPEEDIRFTPDCIDWFTQKEMETVSAIKWEYGAPGTVRVLKEGGLSKGEHQVKLTVCTRTAYIPVPLEGTMTRTVVIE